MTIDELVKIFHTNYVGDGILMEIHNIRSRAGIRAVVERLRDEMASGTAWHALNEILGDEGEKVAGSTPVSTGCLDSVKGEPPASPATDPLRFIDREAMRRKMVDDPDSPCEAGTDPAPAVCEWTPYTDEPLGANWWRTCRGVRHRYKFDGHHPCTSCGKPIKFTEAK